MLKRRTASVVVLPRLKQVEDCLSAEGIRALLYRASRVGGDGRGKRNTVALGGGGYIKTRHRDKFRFFGTLARAQLSEISFSAGCTY
jgi:hypothetical protein